MQIRFLGGWKTLTVSAFALVAGIPATAALPVGDTDGDEPVIITKRTLLQSEGISDGKIAGWPVAADSVTGHLGRKYIHRISMDARLGHVVSTNSFLTGNNLLNRPISTNKGLHLKYSFQSAKGTWVDKAYGSVYQGVGVAFNTFRNSVELGNPWTIYLLQGARICSLSPTIGLFYEWNLGLSWGWVPYERYVNPFNFSIGSKVNAYLNTNFMFRWAVTDQIDFGAGLSLTHYSNGSTKQPNTGVNVVSASVDLTYNFGRDYRRYTKPADVVLPFFQRRMSYEVMVFGSWKRKGVSVDSQRIPSSRKFTVAGLSFAPMYSLGRKIRVGGSLDMVYDGSAAVKYDAIGDDVTYNIPPWNKQLSLGLAGRVDFVMPYFTISAGVGYEVIHASDDYRPTYQMLSLKIGVTRNTFLNIGYRLKNFNNSNFLMFGIGCRFGRGL